MAPMFYEEDLLMLLPALLSSIPSAVFGIAMYVLSALALYTIAKRRELNNPWLAWIPVVNCWIIGSLSDQYQYVVKGQNKSKRKIMLVLNILLMVFALTIAVLAVVMVVGAVTSISEEEIISSMIGPVLAILGVCLPLIGVSVALMVIRYMAMYDIYRSLDPSNAVLFFVLSIFFNITEPFFLFFNRNKDGGMPPRKQPAPAYIPQQAPVSAPEPSAEPWEQENKDYL